MQDYLLIQNGYRKEDIENMEIEEYDYVLAIAHTQYLKKIAQESAKRGI